MYELDLDDVLNHRPQTVYKQCVQYLFRIYSSCVFNKT